ncbi:hypothetical protein BJ912DRAFT_175742 [Pholiota molesta]|nr:hypothetical protein BJ912DRAFT_175742 [Pholiota molesta]
MVTRAEGLSLGDFYESGCTDSNLLNISGTPWCDGIFRQLFRDRSFAGRRHVHSGSYLTLAKQIVAVKFPTLPGGGQRVLVRKTRSGRRRIYDDCVDMLRHDSDSFSKSFSILLSKASMDSDLAQLLLHGALQYYRPFPGDRNNREKSEADRLALGSLFYVQRCGLPYSEHTHPKDTNECVICHYFFW